MTRHLFACPLRWADMDLLGHVNNVTYVDYLQEARVDMFRIHAPASGGEELAEGVVVVRHEVEFVTPLVFRMRPVSVEVWVTEIRTATFTLAYEIFDELPDGGRRVYLRARSVLTPYVFAREAPRRITPEERAVLERFWEPGDSARGKVTPYDGPATVHRYDCHVRFSDVDVYGHVNNVKYYEYFQEARIFLVDALRHATPGGTGVRPPSLVVARLDVDYRRPILFRAEPYAIDSVISRIGRSSFVVSSAIVDDGEVLSRAEAVMVAFDAQTERPLPLTEEQRRVLGA